MTENRIKELQDFALDFQEQLREAKELYQQRQLKTQNLEQKYFKTENNKATLNIEENKNKYKIKPLKNIEQLKLNEHWIPIENIFLCLYHCLNQFLCFIYFI